MQDKQGFWDSLIWNPLIPFGWPALSPPPRAGLENFLTEKFIRKFIKKFIKEFINSSGLGENLHEIN